MRHRWQPSSSGVRIKRATMTGVDHLEPKQRKNGETMRTQTLCFGNFRRSAHICTVVALLGVAGLSQAQEMRRYDNYRAVRVFPTSQTQLMRAMALTDDIWTCEPKPDHVDLMFSPDQFDAFVQLGINHLVIVENVQAPIDEEAQRLGLGQWAANRKPWNANDGGSWYDDYKTLAEIEQHITDLSAAYPTLTSVSVIGQTLQGRDITQIRVAAPGKSGQLPIVFNNSGQHAREWIGPAAVMFTMEQLLEGYGTDPRITALLDEVEFVFVPVVNGDGYDYTWTNERLWRKTRRDNGGGCFGVDPNRNWEFQWSLPGGGSNDPCSDTYWGPSPFSEPEVAALSGSIASLAPNVRAHIDTHSYGQWILHPWGYTSAPSPDESLFDDLGGSIEVAMEATHGVNYTHGQSYILLYQVSGGSKDWVYGTQGAVSWTIELRPIGGNPGFVLPPEQIVPTGEEYLEGVLALGERIAAPLILSSAGEYPSTVSIGQSANVGIRIFESADSLNTNSPALNWRNAGQLSFASAQLTDDGQGNWLIDLDSLSVDCNDAIEYYFSAANTGGGVFVFPPDGTTNLLSTEYVAQDVIVSDTLESETGWTVGIPSDDATAGIWNRNDPQATSAQPGDDHTPAPGVNCYVTDHRAGQSAGTYDVDGGTTTLTSPIMDASDVFNILDDEPYIEYWRWYSNNQGQSPNADSMPVLISNDAGQNWTVLEDVTENAGAWVFKSFRIADFLPPTDQMMIRFQARDLGSGSIVEAAIDDVGLVVRGCPRHPADMDANGVLNIFDYIAFGNFYSAGNPIADFDGNGVLNIFDYIAFGNAYCCL